MRNPSGIDLIYIDLTSVYTEEQTFIFGAVECLGCRRRTINQGRYRCAKCGRYLEWATVLAKYE